MALRLGLLDKNCEEAKRKVVNGLENYIFNNFLENKN